MNLFNEFLSGKFQAVIDLMLAGACGRELSREELETLLEQNHIRGNQSDAIRFFEKLGLLVRTERDRFRLAEGITVAKNLDPPVSRMEEEYLQYAARQPEAQYFLGDLAERLRTDTSDNLSFLQTVQGGDEEPQISPELFQTMLKAIAERYTLCYTYRTREDPQLRADEQIPFRLEYNVFDRRWWLLLYLREQNRTVKVKLEHIRSARLGKKHEVKDEDIREAVCKRYLRKDPVRLLVRDEKNAVERTFLTLGQSPNLTACRQEDGQVLVTFQWFDYDREDLVKKLLYLGDAVTLLGPPEIREHLIRRLREALDIQRGPLGWAASTEEAAQETGDRADRSADSGACAGAHRGAEEGADGSHDGTAHGTDPGHNAAADGSAGRAAHSGAGQSVGEPGVELIHGKTSLYNQT